MHPHPRCELYSAHWLTRSDPDGLGALDPAPALPRPEASRTS